MRIIRFIEDAQVIRDTLTHLGLLSSPRIK
jgi:hypothetical protein